MRRVWAIARLTFSEGIRTRVVLVFLIVLALLVLLMPFSLRGDETLAGRLQNFLDYSLGALGFFLSLATVFFSCATLSNEFKERTLHMVVTKPVSRFQILLGKWLGVNLLNGLIIVLCGAAIYGLAFYIQSRPEQFTRDRYKVRDVVWTARAAAQPTVPKAAIVKAATDYVNGLVATGEVEEQRKRSAIGEHYQALLKQWRVIEPGGYRMYEFDNLSPPEREDTVIQVRFKVIGQPAPTDDIVTIDWTFVDPDTGTPLQPQPQETRERSGEVHQFLFRAAPVIRNGRAALVAENPADPQAPTFLVFDGDNSLQILYKVGSFELNFVRTLAIILLRLSLLSAIGVFFSVFVSFPVACLCTVVFYLICLGLPFWLESVGTADDTYLPKDDPYGPLGPYVRRLLVPFMLVAFPNFSHFDGGRLLVEGEYVSYRLLAQCFVHTLLYGGLLLFVPGWLIFKTREVAEVQV